MAPSFTTTDLDGKRVSLSGYRGKTVLLNFWASWCTPCRREFPLFREVLAARSDVVVLGVVFDDSRSAARDFMEDQHATWPGLVDANGRIARAYKARPGLPETWVIDRDGIVRGRRIGEAVGADIDELLTRANAR